MVSSSRRALRCLVKNGDVNWSTAWAPPAFAAATVGGVDERLAVPFLKVAGRRVGAVGKVREAIMGGDSTAITAQESLAGLAQKAVMFVLSVVVGD